MISRQNFLEKVIDDFEIKGYNFNHIEELNNITIDNKMDISYDYFLNIICMLLNGN